MASFETYGIQVRGNATKVTCPKCAADGKPRNLNLSLDHTRGLWNCHRPACGFKGSVEHGPADGSKRSAPVFRDTSAVKPKAYKKPERLPNREQSDDRQRAQVKAFFENRKIGFQTALDAGVTWGMARMPQFEQPQFTIQVPYYRDGEIINVKYRGPKGPDGKKTFKMTTGAELTFWGLDTARGSAEIIITEGEWDALACWECGLRNVLSVPNGANDERDDGSPPDQDLRYLSSGEDLFTFADRIVIATDGDRPGRYLATELARRIGRERCYFVQYPEGTKDLGEVLVNYGPEKVRELVADAEPYPIEGVFNVATLTERVLEFAQNGFAEGLDTGWRGVSELYRPVAGMLSIVTGVPSHGKSVFVDNLCLNIATMYPDWKFAIFSPEMYPPELHASLQLERMFEKPINRRAGINAITDEEIVKGMAELGESFWVIDPEEPDLDEILERARILVLRHGIKGLVIDPWTELVEPDGMTELKFIKDGLSKVRRFARQYAVHVWIVAHPTKLPPEESGEDGARRPRVPGPYDISGASHWANKGDFILTVYQRERWTEIHVTKVRFQPTYGQKGVAKLLFNSISKRFVDYNDIGARRMQNVA